MYRAMDSEQLNASMGDSPSELNRNGTARVSSYTGARRDVVALIPHEARKILDVGCSAGGLAMLLKQRSLGEDVDVWGIELDRALADEAAKRLKNIIVGDACASIEQLISAGESFDVVVLADVLEHLVDPWHTLALAARLLAPGGCIVISLPNVGFWTTYAGLLAGRWPYRTRGVHDSSHLRWFAHHNLNDLLQRADLTAIEFERKYRFIDVSHPINRFANIPGRVFPGPFTYQFLVRASRTTDVPTVQRSRPPRTTTP